MALEFKISVETDKIKSEEAWGRFGHWCLRFGGCLEAGSCFIEVSVCRARWLVSKVNEA